MGMLARKPIAFPQLRGYALLQKIDYLFGKVLPLDLLELLQDLLGKLDRLHWDHLLPADIHKGILIMAEDGG